MTSTNHWRAGWGQKNLRRCRERLLAQWSEAPAKVAADCTPKPSLVQVRHGKALTDLARWTRKAKFAQTKVKKLRFRVRYYERKLSEGTL